MPPNQKYIIFVKTTIPASTTAEEEDNAKVKITEITRKLAQIIKVFKRGEIKFGGFVEIKGKELASLYGDKLECTSKCSLVPSLVSFSSNKPNESILGKYTNCTGEIQNLQFSKNAYTELAIDGIINQAETLDKINKRTGYGLIPGPDFFIYLFFIIKWVYKSILQTFHNLFI